MKQRKGICLLIALLSITTAALPGDLITAVQRGVEDYRQYQAAKNRAIQQKISFYRQAKKRLTQAEAALKPLLNKSWIGSKEVNVGLLVPQGGSNMHGYRLWYTKPNPLTGNTITEKVWQRVKNPSTKQIEDKLVEVKKKFYYDFDIDSEKAWSAVEPELYFGFYDEDKDEWIDAKMSDPQFDSRAFVKFKNSEEVKTALSIIASEKEEIIEELKKAENAPNSMDEEKKHEREKDKAMSVAAAQQAIANKGAAKNIELIFSQLRNPVYAGILLALFGGGVAAYHGIPKLLAPKPQVISEMSFRTPLEKLLGKKRPQSNIDKVVLAPGTNIKISRFTKRIQRVLAQGGEMMNMIFYGPPGTGKTMTAKAMARASGAEYMIINGAAFEQLPASKIISELEGVFRLAKTSKKPVVVFWDEADAALGKRGGDKETIESRRLINTFLSNVSDTHNSKIMFILATNLPNTLDDAVLSRFPKEGWIFFGRPSVDERAKILNMYLTDFLNANQFAVSPEARDGMPNFAERLDKATGRDLRALARAISDRMFEEDAKVLSPDLVNTVIDETQANEEQIGSYVYGE